MPIGKLFLIHSPTRSSNSWSIIHNYILFPIETSEHIYDVLKNENNIPPARSIFLVRSLAVVYH